MTKNRNIRQPRKPWSEQERGLLRREYPHVKTEVIAKQLGRRLFTVYQQAATLGLKKSAEYLASPAASRLRRGDNVGSAFRFGPGHVPANKGLRRPGWSPGRMRQTQFKKGNRPHTWRHPTGSTRLVDGYLYEKVREASPWTKAWRQSHYLLWERAGRTIPPGHVLVFRDGDRTHIALENLELITRRELVARNHWRRLPAALKQVMMLRVAIKRKITMRTRDEQHDRRPEKAPVRHTGRAKGQGKAARYRAREGRV